MCMSTVLLRAPPRDDRTNPDRPAAGLARSPVYSPVSSASRQGLKRRCQDGAVARQEGNRTTIFFTRSRDRQGWVARASLRGQGARDVPCCTGTLMRASLRCEEDTMRRGSAKGRARPLGHATSTPCPRTRRAARRKGNLIPRSPFAIRPCVVRKPPCPCRSPEVVEPELCGAAGAGNCSGRGGARQVPSTSSSS